MPYPLALVITLGVEVPIYAGVLSYAGILRGWRAIAAAVGVNVFSHPLAWLVLMPRPGWLLTVELAVCVVEAGLLWLLARRRAAGVLLLSAVVANTASVLAGILLYGLVR
jgi:hypothetical protein